MSQIERQRDDDILGQTDGSSDESFANQLLAMAKRDAARADASPGAVTERSVALWMADELVRRADTLAISADLAATMKREARQLRNTVRSIDPKTSSAPPQLPAWERA